MCLPSKDTFKKSSKSFDILAINMINQIELTLLPKASSLLTSHLLYQSKTLLKYWDMYHHNHIKILSIANIMHQRPTIPK